MKIVAILAVFAIYGAYAKPSGNQIDFNFNVDNGDFSVFKRNAVDFIEKILIPLLARKAFSDIIYYMKKLSSTLDGMENKITNYPSILTVVDSIFKAAYNSDSGKDMKPTIYVGFKLLENAIELAQGM